MAASPIVAAALRRRDQLATAAAQERRPAIEQVVDAIEADEWQMLAAPVIEPILARAATNPEGLLARPGVGLPGPEGRRADRAAGARAVRGRRLGPADRRRAGDRRRPCPWSAPWRDACMPHLPPARRPRRRRAGRLPSAWSRPPRGSTPRPACPSRRSPGGGSWARCWTASGPPACGTGAGSRVRAEGRKRPGNAQSPGVHVEAGRGCRSRTSSPQPMQGRPIWRRPPRPARQVRTAVAALPPRERLIIELPLRGGARLQGHRRAARTGRALRPPLSLRTPRRRRVDADLADSINRRSTEAAGPTCLTTSTSVSPPGSRRARRSSSSRRRATRSPGTGGRCGSPRTPAPSPSPRPCSRTCWSPSARRSTRRSTKGHDTPGVRAASSSRTLRASSAGGDAKIVVDPDGGAERVQLGSPHRLRTIFDSNMRSTFGAARQRHQDGERREPAVLDV